jgi:hypothetical protein
MPSPDVELTTNTSIPSASPNICGPVDSLTEKLRVMARH